MATSSKDTTARDLGPPEALAATRSREAPRLVREPTYRALKILAAASLPLVLLASAILTDYGLEPVFDSPFLVTFLNTIFISLISFAFAYVALRAYVRTGIVRIVLVGSATLLFGLNSGLSGFLFNTMNGNNHAITAYNISALAAGILHFGAAALFNTRIVILEKQGRRLKQILLAYAGVILFTALLTYASASDLLPPFFIQETGPTLLRQIVLGLAVVCWASAAALLLVPYRHSQTEFLYWYSLALALTATGLGAVFFQSATGSLLNWAGRFAQQLGGLYFGVAISLIVREAQVKGIAFELQVASFFRDAEANYRDLVQNASDAILAVDEVGTILLWNPAAEQTFGYSREEALGTSAFDLLFGKDAGKELYIKWENHIRRSARERGQRTSELVARRKDGRLFPIDLTLSTRPQGRRLISTLILRDITERKKAEESLHAAMQAQHLSELRFRTALKHAPVTVFSQDLDLRYTWAFNPWGIDSTDLVGQSSEKIVPQFPEELDVIKRDVIDSGSGSRTEMRATGLDGLHHFYDITVDPLKDAAGSIIGVTCSAIDITEYKLAAERIQSLNCEIEKRAIELEIANRELEAFAYSVSHDLRTPLASIAGLTRVLEEDHASEMSPAAQRYLGFIRSGTQQMDDLIQGLLGLARLSRHALKTEPVQMTALVRESLANVPQEADRENLTIDIQELPDAQGDAVLLKQVWINLLSNAVKFTRTKSDARVEVGSGLMSMESGEWIPDKKSVNNSTPPGSLSTVYYVRDNGVGFDMDQAERLFGLFQRMHAEEEYEGTGVGLAIVARIIRRHGGRVWAEAEVDQGATFFFTLGLTNGSEAPAGPNSVSTS